MKKVVQSESDMQRLTDLCVAFGKIKLEWAENLKTEATKADPSKETVNFNFNPPKFEIFDKFPNFL